MLASVTQPNVGSNLMPGLPLEFSGAGRNAPELATILGQHTEEVLMNILGLTTQIGNLLGEKTIQTASCPS